MCKECKPGKTVVSETTFGQAPFVGIECEKFAREDHTHGTPSAPVIPSASNTVVTEETFGQLSDAGTSSTYSRGDHTHGTPALPPSQNPATTVITEESFGQSAAVGTLLSYAREDHTHGTPPAPALYTPGPAVDETTNRGINGIYQNTTGRPILVMVSLSITPIGNCGYPFCTADCITDSNNPPAALVARVGIPTNPNEQILQAVFFVKNGDFYQVFAHGSFPLSIIVWMELTL